MSVANRRDVRWYTSARATGYARMYVGTVTPFSVAFCASLWAVSFSVIPEWFGLHLNWITSDVLTDKMRLQIRKMLFTKNCPLLMSGRSNAWRKFWLSVNTARLPTQIFFSRIAEWYSARAASTAASSASELVRDSGVEMVFDIFCKERFRQVTPIPTNSFRKELSVIPRDLKTLLLFELRWLFVYPKQLIYVSALEILHKLLSSLPLNSKWPGTLRQFSEMVKSIVCFPSKLQL